ncbi:MAG: RNA methyltransferase [Clostridia bacterium]|nr:RNA methyltransferase [Clostridia bacterium]
MDKNYQFISSKNNERIKRFASLSERKYRDALRQFLAEGVKLAEEAAEARCASCLLICEDALERADVKLILDKCGDDVIKYILTRDVFDKVSTERAPQGLIAVSEYLPNHKTDAECPPRELDGRRVIALDGVRDPGNLGTILRTAAAMGYDCVLLGECADIYNTKTVRASMGAIYRISTVVCRSLPDYLSELSDAGRRIVATSLSDDSVDFVTFEKRPSDIPVIGNEGHGLSEGVASCCDSFVKIPMSSGVESLNAGTASSIIMWEYFKIG